MTWQDNVSVSAQLSQAVATMCVESMALRTAAAPKLPGNLETCVDEIGVAGVEQPGLGDSAVALLLVIEPTWLGNVYDGQ